MALQIGDISKRLDKRDKAIKKERIDKGTLGRNRPADFESIPRNLFSADQRDSPEYEDFYRAAFTFPYNDAINAQNRYNALASTFDFPDFGNEPDNVRASDWLYAYRDGAKRGLISLDDEVGPWSIEALAVQPANSGASTINPNEANKFPSKGIAI